MPDFIDVSDFYENTSTFIDKKPSGAIIINGNGYPVGSLAYEADMERELVRIYRVYDSFAPVVNWTSCQDIQCTKNGTGSGPGRDMEQLLVYLDECLFTQDSVTQPTPRVGFQVILEAVAAYYIKTVNNPADYDAVQIISTAEQYLRIGFNTSDAEECRTVLPGSSLTIQGLAASDTIGLYSASGQNVTLIYYYR